MTDTLWDAATRDVDAEVDARRMAALRVAVQPHFGFLAKASDSLDWDSRFALVLDRVTASVERVVGHDLAPTFLTRIAAELQADWSTVRMAHLAPRIAETGWCQCHHPKSEHPDGGACTHTGVGGDKCSCTSYRESEDVPLEKGSSRKTAEDAYDYDDSCAVCGHGINRDPAGERNRTYHHADGEKHDHEAKPKTAARTAIRIGDMEAYNTTCPNKDCIEHGTAFVHDDLAGDDSADGEEATCPECGTPLVVNGPTRPAQAAKTAGGLDNLGDNKAAPFGSKDDDEDDDSTTKESKTASAPDGTKAKCGTCGKDIESMDYAWYHMAKDFPHGEDHPAHPSPHKSSMRKGAPFAGYEDFDACVKANSDKDDPEAYCGKIKHQVEDNKTSAKTADGVGPTEPNWDPYAAYQQACKDSGSTCVSRSEWEANPEKFTSTTGSRTALDTSNLAGEQTKVCSACRGTGVGGGGGAHGSCSVCNGLGKVKATTGSIRVTSLATLAPGTRLSATSAYLKQAGYPMCAEDCGETLSASDDLINTDSGLAHTSCVLGDVANDPASRLGFSQGLRAFEDGFVAAMRTTSADGGGWHDAATKTLTMGPQKVDGMLLDAYTASMLTQVHDALSPANQAKFRGMPLKKAVDIGWQLTKKTSARTASDDGPGEYRVTFTTTEDSYEYTVDADSESEAESKAVPLAVKDGWTYGRGHTQVTKTSAHTPRPGEIRGKCKRCGEGVHVRGGHDESGTYDVWRHDNAARDLEHSVSPMHHAEGEPRMPMVDWMGNVLAATTADMDEINRQRKQMNCPTCKGAGRISQGPGMDLGPGFPEFFDCPDCDGTGFRGGHKPKTSSYYLANSEGEHIDGPFTDREDANSALSMNTSDDLHVVEDDSEHDDEGEFHYHSMLAAITQANLRAVTGRDEDGTNYGAWGDHCPHCGSDWKRGCSPDCLRNTDPHRAAELEEAAHRHNNPHLYRDPTPSRERRDGDPPRHGEAGWETWMSASRRTAAFGDVAWTSPNTNTNPAGEWAEQNGLMAGTIDALEGKPFNDGGGANGKGAAYAKGYRQGFNAAGGAASNDPAAGVDEARERTTLEDRFDALASRATPSGRETDPTWHDHGTCPDCHGSGQVPSLSPHDDPDNSGLQTCPTCNGTGRADASARLGPTQADAEVLANPKRTRVACRKCHAGRDASGDDCDYCDGQGSLDQTLAMVKEADGWSQGITAEAFKQASPTYQSTQLPNLDGQDVTLTYTSDLGVDTVSGQMHIEGNTVHVGGRSFPMHAVLEVKANGYGDSGGGAPGRDPGPMDYLMHGNFPSGAMASRQVTANPFTPGAANPFTVDGPGSPGGGGGGGGKPKEEEGEFGGGSQMPTTTHPRAKPNSQPNAPEMDPMRSQDYAMQQAPEFNSPAPVDMTTPRAAARAKVVEIAEGILSTNPGMNDRTAMAIATETVRRFPKVVAAGDIKPHRFVPDPNKGGIYCKECGGSKDGWQHS